MEGNCGHPLAEQLKRLRPGVIPRVQMERSSPGKLRGALLTGQFSGRKRNGRMGGASRSAVKSSLDKHVTHDAPDTRAVAPRSGATADATAGHEAGRG